MKLLERDLLKHPLFFIKRYFAYFVWFALLGFSILFLLKYSITINYLEFFLIYTLILVISLFVCFVLGIKNPMFYLYHPRAWYNQHILELLKKIQEKLEKGEEV
jgi:hypothetical protein